MKKVLRSTLALSLLAAFGATSLQAGWKIVDNSDGAQLVCCKKKRVVKKRPKKVVKKKVIPCDEIPTAVTYPVEPGEKLAPAEVKRCIGCDIKYGTIGK